MAKPEVAAAAATAMETEAPDANPSLKSPAKKKKKLKRERLEGNHSAAGAATEAVEEAPAKKAKVEREEKKEANPSPAKREKKLKRERLEGNDSAAGVAAEAAEEASAKKAKGEEEKKEANPSLKSQEKKTKKPKRERLEGNDSAAGAAAEGAEEAQTKKAKGEEEGAKGEELQPVKLGPMEFTSAMDMYDYFFKLLHSWSTRLDFNKYECMVLEDLVRKGHADPARKIGSGIEAFGIHNNRRWHTLCFFIRRADGSTEDFSFSKCVNNILPLPKDMISK